MFFFSCSGQGGGCCFHTSLLLQDLGEGWGEPVEGRPGDCQTCPKLDLGEENGLILLLSMEKHPADA